MGDGGAEKVTGTEAVTGAEAGDGGAGAEEVAGALRRASGQKWQWRGGAGAGGRGGREQMRDRGAGRGSLTGLQRVLSLPAKPPPTGARTRAQAGQRPRPAQLTFGFLSPQTLGGPSGRPRGGGRGAGGGRALAQPAPPPSGPAGAVGPAGVASAPRGGGAGGLGPAPLRGGDCGGRLNGTRGRCRPQPYPKERGPSGQLGACEARHGGEADEPGWPRVYREGAGLV